MLEGFRKRDVSRPQNSPPESAYSKLNQALATVPAETAKSESAKVEAPKMDAVKPQEPAKPGDKVACKLTVGPDIKLKGAEITDCDTLVVEGRVEASMNSRVIQIAESGVFVGKVGIEVAQIRGRFEGELTAHRQLVIHASGRVSGTIRYGSISIEEGGELTGDIGTIASTKAVAAGVASDHSRAPASDTVSVTHPPTGAAGMRAASIR